MNVQEMAFELKKWKERTTRTHGAGEQAALPKSGAAGKEGKKKR